VHYDKRLEALAERRRLCAVHLAPLLCAACDFRWVGTDAEFCELQALSARYDRDSPRMGPPDPARVCPRHPNFPLWCEPCFAAAARQVKGPRVTVPAADVQRYDALMRRLVRTAHAVSVYPPGDPQYVIADAWARFAQGLPISGDSRERLAQALSGSGPPDAHGGTDDAL
jgi:hypothetical protein